MYKSIVVGTDGSPTAAMAVDAAAGLAQLSQASLHLVCAYKEPAVTAVASGVWAPGAGEALRECAEVERDTAQNHLAQTAARLEGQQLKIETYAVPGDASAAILSVAESTGSDLVVVGSKGMTGARRVLGSVPNSVTHHASCAVLVVKTG